MMQQGSCARPSHVPEERVVDFDIYAPPGLNGDLHAAWSSLQDSQTASLVWTPRNGGHWIATRCQLVGEVYADHQRFSARTVIVPRPQGYDQLPHTLDPPEHRPFRALLNAGLSPKVVNQREAKVRKAAVALIEAVQPAGHCNFTADYAEIFPIQVFLGLVDLPIEDAKMLKSWSDQMVRPDGTMSIEEALRRFREYLDPWIDARFGGTGEDLLSRIVNGTIAGRPLTRDEAQRMMSTVLTGGLDTVVNALGFVMLFLARNPGHRRQLVEDPGLIPAAVDELLRRFPVVTLGREVRSDVVVDDVQLLAGEIVMAPTLLAGIDPRANERPLEVDFHRPGSEHMTFGSGPHKCPGSFLARTELRVTLEEWLQRIPNFEIAPGHEIKFKSGLVGTVASVPLVWAA